MRQQSPDMFVLENYTNGTKRGQPLLWDRIGTPNAKQAKKYTKAQAEAEIESAAAAGCLLREHPASILNPWKAK